MPITYNKPDQGLSFRLPDEGEVFRAAGDIQNFYRRTGNRIENLNFVDAFLPASERGAFGNAGDQVREAQRRAQAQGFNLDAQEYNIGDVFSSGLFERQNAQSLAFNYGGDVNSFFQRAALPTSQQTLTRQTNTINPYAPGNVTDQFGNIVQAGPTATVAENQARAMAQNAGLLAPTPEMVQAAQANAQMMGDRGVPMGVTPQNIVPTTATLPRQQLIQGQINPAAQQATNLNEYYQAIGTPLPSLTDRAALYSSLQGRGLIPSGGGEYRGTASQNNALLSALQQTTNFGGTANTQDIEIAKTMTADILSGVDKLAIPPRQAGGLTMDSFLSQFFTPEYEQALAKEDAYTKRLADLTRESGNKQRDLNTLYDVEGGVYDIEKDINDTRQIINNEKQIFLKQQQDILNQQGVARGAMIGQNAQAENQHALKIGQWGIVLDALTGNYNAALNKAQNLVEAKYSGIESEINYTRLLLEANDAKLSRAEKKQAQALDMYLQFRQEAIQDQKTEENGIMEIALDAQKNGATGAVMQKIMQAKTRQDALLAAGNYIGKLDREAAALDASYKRAQIANVGSGADGKPASDTQILSAGYAKRIQESGQIIDNLAGQISRDNYLYYQAQTRLPYSLRDERYKSYDQASRNLINAILRKESGAQITEAEFENAYKQYLPVPGDTPQTIEQKRRNREDAYNTFVQAAGPAGSQGTQTTGGTVVRTGTTASGVGYKIIQR